MNGKIAFLVLAALGLAAGLGCDRTRPYPGATANVMPPPAGAPAAATAPGAGPVETSAGWKFTFHAPDATSVSLAGSFNAWSASADPLKRGANGAWEIVKALPAGSHQYKFVVDGTQWKEDPTNPKSADDGYGGKNSLLETGGGAVAPAAGAAPQAAAVAGSAPTRTDAGWKFTFHAPDATSVSLAGSFNAWSASADPLKKGEGDVWEIVKALPAGSHQYKFVVNGVQWKQDPGNPQLEDDGYGGKNSLLVVP